MNFLKLEQYVEAVREGYSLGSVLFGCDCGCGGDNFTTGEWDSILEDAQSATDLLTDFGVKFPHDS